MLEMNINTAHVRRDGTEDREERMRMEQKYKSSTNLRPPGKDEILRLLEAFEKNPTRETAWQFSASFDRIEKIECLTLMEEERIRAATAKAVDVLGSLALMCRSLRRAS